MTTVIVVFTGSSAACRSFLFGVLLKSGSDRFVVRGEPPPAGDDQPDKNVLQTNRATDATVLVMWSGTFWC